MSSQATEGRGSDSHSKLDRFTEWLLQKLSYISVTTGHDEYMKEIGERQQRNGDLNCERLVQRAPATADT
ncbi:unnamed protein product [Caretta caretta]